MRILSLCAVLLLIFSLAVPAFGAVLDPYQNGTVTIDGNLEIVSVKLNTSNMFWQRFHDGTASYNGTGSNLTYSTQMRYVDNDTVSCWPFGVTTYILTSGIPTGSHISVDMSVGLNISNQSQSFECVGYLYLDTYDSRGSVIARNTIWTETQSAVDGSHVFFIDPSIDTSILSGSYQWSLTFSFDFNGVSNESDTTSVTLQCFGENISVDIPYSQLYQLQQQGEKTNQLLQQIDSAMQENGQKLDEIMNNTVPSVRPDGQDKVDDLDDAEAGLRDDASSGLDEGLAILDDALDILVTYTQAFSALGLIFGYFAGIPFFSALLYLSFALGILATILGVGLSVASRFGNSHSNREGKSSSGGNSK